MSDDATPPEALARDAAERELARLAQEIRRHDELYYTRSAPELSDAEYDVLRRRNEAIEARFPDLKRADSPSDRVGAPPASSFAKVRHTRPMLSLGNALNDDDLAEFEGRVRRFLNLDEEEQVVLYGEPKIDGLSATLHYHEGRLVLGATRGDGETGEDVTENLRTLRDLPHTLTGADVPERLEVRGEVYIGLADFAALNREREAEGEEAFVNPRNTASGGLRQIDTALTAKRRLRFFAHGWGEVSEALGERQGDVLARLAAWGFALAPHARRCTGLDEARALHREIEAVRPRSTSRSTVSSSRSTASTGRGVWAPPGGRRAGPSRTSSRPSRSRTSCTGSRSRSGAPARSPLWPSWSRCSSAASPSRARRSITRT